jgi:hypothetical protein
LRMWQTVEFQENFPKEKAEKEIDFGILAV